MCFGALYFRQTCLCANTKTIYSIISPLSQPFNMQAFQVYPVLLTNIPQSLCVNQLRTKIFEKRSSDLVFSAPSISPKQQYLLAFRSLQTQIELVHRMNRSKPKSRLKAVIPRRPYLHRRFMKSQLKQIKNIRNYKFKAQHKHASSSAWTSYQFLNCISLEIARIIEQPWTLLPISEDVWHFVLLPSGAHIARRPCFDGLRIPLSAERHFHGHVLDEKEQDNAKLTLKQHHKNESIGLLWNSEFECHQIFEVKEDFVDRPALLRSKKAAFTLCLSRSAINQSGSRSLFHLKAAQHLYATNVQIAVPRGDHGDDDKAQRRRRVVIKRRDAKAKRSLSRVADVRSWGDEIKAFLGMSGNEQYFAKFLAHNLHSLRLECITAELLVYCGIPSATAEAIMADKAFFDDWLSPRFISLIFVIEIEIG